MSAHPDESSLNALIEARNFAALRNVFADWLPVDVAERLRDLPAPEQAILFRMLPQSRAAKVLEYMDADTQFSVLRALGNEDAARVLNDMSPDDRTAFLEDLPPNAVIQTLKLLSPEELAVARTLLNYPEGSVGRLMTPDFVSVRDDWTVLEVIEHIRALGTDSETLNVIYVTTDTGRLIDDVRIREFLLKPFDAKVKELRDDKYLALRATDDSAEAARLFKKYDRNTLPVVDSENCIIGIVTIDDVLDVIEEDTTRKVQMIGGLEALDEPYATIPLVRMIKKRATWLVVLFLSEMLTATAMGYYEGEISKAVVLAVFLPLIISSGGNSGSQATTLIIRAMALGEITPDRWRFVLRREIGSGLWLGLVLGMIGFGRIMLWQILHFQDYGPHFALVALTVGLSLIGVVTWGSISGSMLPFLLRRLGLDPATSSAPFVATLVDVTGLVIYFNVAFFILRGTVL
ncbi:MAG TPA: magnesium transporter [Verrucomicrobiales bacterium]|nr:magnesium transporter [Verrucomicrobiales bacterium]